MMLKYMHIYRYRSWKNEFLKKKSSTVKNTYYLWERSGSKTQYFDQYWLNKSISHHLGSVAFLCI